LIAPEKNRKYNRKYRCIFSKQLAISLCKEALVMKKLFLVTLITLSLSVAALAEMAPTINLAEEELLTPTIEILA
jgi:hypothetical protein